MLQTDGPIMLDRTGDELDGRRQRGEANRERIVKAMLELVGEGNIAPSAEDVAARANVGLRTVFRHFENMESLYRQIDAQIEAEIRPIAERPFAADDARTRLAEMIDRRVRIFERIMPYKIAGSVHQHRSPFLAAQSATLNREQRRGLCGLLPKGKRDDAVFVEELDLVLSFDTWRRLRKDQKLSVKRAREVIEHLTGLLWETG